MGTLLRARTKQEARVTSVELFFDLVFVFGVTQLSHRLLTHLDPRGALETGLLLAATWWVWVFTAWVTNWLDPDRTAVRLLLFVLMALGLFLSMAIPTAYASRGLVFALSYVGMHIVRSGFMLFALRGAEPGPRRSFARITAWFAASGLFWIAGGFCAGDVRLALWVVAMAVELAGPAVGFATPGYGRTEAQEWDIDGHHLAERCGLFIIIALGESILVTGDTVATQQWSGTDLAAFGVALVGSIAMWWIYFNIGAAHGAHRIANEDSPGLLGRLSYTYFHLPIVAGVIVCAAADDVMLAHPIGHLPAGAVGVLIAGPALFLFGNMLFKRTTQERLPLSHLAGLGVLVAMIPFATRVAPMLVGTGATLALLLTAIWESLAFRHADKPDGDPGCEDDADTDTAPAD